MWSVTDTRMFARAMRYVARLLDHSVPAARALRIAGAAVEVPAVRDGCEAIASAIRDDAPLAIAFQTRRQEVGARLIDLLELADAVRQRKPDVRQREHVHALELAAAHAEHEAMAQAAIESPDAPPSIVEYRVLHSVATLMDQGYPPEKALRLLMRDDDEGLVREAARLLAALEANPHQTLAEWAKVAIRTDSLREAITLGERLGGVSRPLLTTTRHILRRLSTTREGTEPRGAESLSDAPADALVKRVRYEMMDAIERLGLQVSPPRREVLDSADLGIMCNVLLRLTEGLERLFDRTVVQGTRGRALLGAGRAVEATPFLERALEWYVGKYGERNHVRAGSADRG